MKLYVGTANAERPTSVSYNPSLSHIMNMVSIGLIYFDKATGRMMRLCDGPAYDHDHYVPYEYPNCYEYMKALTEKRDTSIYYI